MENREPSTYQWMKGRRLTQILAALTLFALLLSIPQAARDAREQGWLYLFSWAFLEDIPRRLTGPGRFRVILQPLMAILLGIRSGLADARTGKPPFLYGLIFHREHRRELYRNAFRTVINLLLMGILMDSLFQWVLFGISHPGAALVVGPMLILLPYSLARALTNHLGRWRLRRKAGE